MSTIAACLTDFGRAAAVYIDVHGWTQGQMDDGTGCVCLTGALKHCCPVPGDFELVREVHRQRDRGERWNDAEDRTAEEVRTYLATEPITDADLEGTFGPRWRVIVTVVRTLASATPEQHERLCAAVAEQTGSGANTEAAEAIWRAAMETRRVLVWDAVWTASRCLIWEAARPVVAFMVADLVGQSGLTNEHFETLTQPYVAVFGQPEAVAS